MHNYIEKDFEGSIDNINLEEANTIIGIFSMKFIVDSNISNVHKLES